jgi:hypothetical protein
MPLSLLACVPLALSGSGGSWQAISPGGATSCSHGGKYTFFVSPGTVNKLVIELEGGGCCFDAITCATPIYTRSVDAKAELRTLENRKGLGSAVDERNPVKGWTRVFVPYCTGDAHLGNHTAKYGVHHVGRLNAFAALQWAFDHVADPEAVLVTGISAGAVGSYVLAPWAFGHYRHAAHFHLADSYAPVFGRTGYNGGLANWKLADAFDFADIPEIAPGSITEWSPLVNAANTNYTALAFPNATFSAYVSAADTVEEGFYVAEGCGLEGCDWKGAMRDALDAVTAPNFYRFVAPGTTHGVIGGDGVYSKKSKAVGTGQEVTVGGWITDMLAGKQIPNVDCKGQGC